MNDDIGLLITRLNHFLDQLSSLILGLKGEITVVSEHSATLSESMRQSSLALALMKSSSQKIVREGGEQSQRITEADNNVGSIAKNAQDVENQVLVQSSAIEQSSAAINQLAANVSSVAALTDKAEILGSRLKESSAQGQTSIKGAISSVQEIKTASEEVQIMVKAIQKIASQTNLLSMNAAIEAAHAGDAGAGFAVVASEVGVLAGSSAKSAKEIQQRIKEMDQKVEKGVDAIIQAGAAFTEINSAIEQTSELITTISNAMNEQSAGAAESLKGTDSIVAAIESIKQLAIQQREYTASIAAAMKGLVDSAKAVDAAVHENAENSESLSTSIQKVEGCVEESSMAVKHINEKIGVFKLEN